MVKVFVYFDFILNIFLEEGGEFVLVFKFWVFFFIEGGFVFFVNFYYFFVDGFNLVIFFEFFGKVIVVEDKNDFIGVY